MAGRGRDAPGFLAESSLLPRPAKAIHGVQDASLLPLHAVLESYKDRRRGQAPGKASQPIRATTSKDRGGDVNMGDGATGAAGSFSATVGHVDVQAFLAAAIGLSAEAAPIGQGQPETEQGRERQPAGRTTAAGHPWRDPLAQVYGPGWEEAGAHLHSLRGAGRGVGVGVEEGRAEAAMEARYKARREAALAALQAVQAATTTGAASAVPR